MDDLPEVEFKLAWQTYRVGDRIRPPGSLRDWLIANGYVDAVEVEMPGRPGRLSARAAAKLAEGQKKLLG